MIRIDEIRLSPDHTPEDLERKIRKELSLSRDEKMDWKILKQSVDAHKRPLIFLVYSAEVRLAPARERRILKKNEKNRKISLSARKEYHFPFHRLSPALHIPDSEGNSQMNTNRPVIIGCGPAGLFCALMLAQAGLCPLLIERGAPVEQRIDDVRRFWETGRLDTESNVQFGEGGAGAFSDGKLNSAIKDPDGRVRFVLETFSRFGADPSVCYSYKPHVGTDVLSTVIRRIREEIIRLGGEYRFHTCLEGIRCLQDAGQLPDNRCLQDINVSANDDSGGDPACMEKTVKKNSGILWELQLSDGSVLKSSRVVLATGHSARDTYRFLYHFGLKMSAKPFAAGLRIQHPQKMINNALYGKDCPYDLGAAPYKLAWKSQSGRGVYSFCMCPGGYVVNASSETDMLAVNGMSYHDRAGENANSAIVVTVTPEDYVKWSGTDCADDPLSGIAFQRCLERRAFEAGKGDIPIQTFRDYCDTSARAGHESAEHSDLEETVPETVPAVKGHYRYADLREIFPEEITDSIREGIHAFGKKIKGFDRPDALLCAVESRTSSPVRIERNDQLEAVGFPGIYPCGEGAGYAGGITSAAVDGIRVAEKIAAGLYCFQGQDS